jgi:UDP-N-acetylmuramate--alanine ligase
MHYSPHYAIVTSAELDHIDVFDTVEKQMKAFDEFCATVASSGLLLLCSDSAEVNSIHRNIIKSRVQTYGLEGEPNWKATSIRVANNRTHFLVTENGETIGEFSLLIPGNHNVQNALPAIAISLDLGISIETIQSALSTFQGVERRFEILQDRNGIAVIEDFAHHPSAIKTTLSAVKLYFPGRRIWCVYEPHTYTRIKGLLEHFRDAFKDADEVLLADIYPAREKALKGLVHTSDIMNLVKKDRRNIHYFSTYDQIFSYLLANIKINDVVIFMAVGRMGNMADKLVQHVDTIS